MHAPVKTGNQIADPTGEVNADEAEQRTSDSGPHDTEHDVQEKPHLALHELLCEPTGNSAYDDGCNPADLLFFHWSPLLVGSAIKIHFNPYVVVKQYVRTNAPQVFALGQWIKPPTAAPSDATKQGVHHELRRKSNTRRKSPVAS